jgi:hypothetical protein
MPSPRIWFSSKKALSVPVFHIYHSVSLGWSPVARSWLKRKRKSDLDVDENEDGRRAIVVEEGIAALAFDYATKHV